MVPLYRGGCRYGSIWLVSNGREPASLIKRLYSPLSGVHRLANGPGCRSSISLPRYCCLKHPTLQCLLLSVPVLHSNSGTQKKAGFSQCAIKSRWHEKCKPCGQGAGQIRRKKLQMAWCRPSATKSHLNEGCFCWFLSPSHVATWMESNCLKFYTLTTHCLLAKVFACKTALLKSCSEHTRMMHSYQNI